MPSSDTQFKPGQPRPAGAGRQKGIPNKKTTEMKVALLDLAIDMVPDIRLAIMNMFNNPGYSTKEYLNVASKILLIAARTGAMSALSGADPTATPSTDPASTPEDTENDPDPFHA